MKKFLILFTLIGLTGSALADTFTNVVATNNITAQNNLTVQNLLKCYGNIDLVAGNLLQVNRADIYTVNAIDGIFANDLTVGYPGNNNRVYVKGYVHATDKLITSGYVQANGIAYLGSYAGGWALTVSNTDGAVVMKKAQGDISMGIYQ